MHPLGMSENYLDVKKSFFESNFDAVSSPIQYLLWRGLCPVWGYHIQMVPPGLQARNSKAVYIASVIQTLPTPLLVYYQYSKHSDVCLIFSPARECAKKYLPYS